MKTPETVCHEIFREIVRQSRQFVSKELLILAHRDVVDRLLDEESAALAELEPQVGRPIRLQAEALYGVDQYDVVLISKAAQSPGGWRARERARAQLQPPGD